MQLHLFFYYISVGSRANWFEACKETENRLLCFWEAKFYSIHLTNKLPGREKYTYLYIYYICYQCNHCLHKPLCANVNKTIYPYPNVSHRYTLVKKSQFLLVVKCVISWIKYQTSLLYKIFVRKVWFLKKL